MPANGLVFSSASAWLKNQTLAMAVLSAGRFCATGVIAAAIWRRYFDRGPLEWIRRRATG